MFNNKLKKPLTEREQISIINEAKEFYYKRRNSISAREGKYYFYGIEIEHSLLDMDNLLPSIILGKKIVRNLNNPLIKEEFASFQIEQNSKKFKLSEGSFMRVLSQLEKQRDAIHSLAKKNNSYLFSAGLSPNFPLKLFHEHFISNPYFRDEEKFDPNKIKKPFILHTIKKNKVFVHSTEEIWAIINSMHIHFQPSNIDECIKAFNYSMMLIPFMCAISANAGYFKGLLSQKDVRIELICENKSNFFSKEEGFLPNYLVSIDDFFDCLFKLKPFFRYTGDTMNSSFSSFSELIEQNAFFVQFRLDESSKSGLRTELKTISTQPTIKENVAIAMFYILLLKYMIDKNFKLVDIEIVEKDTHKAMSSGIKANIHFSVGKKIIQEPAYKLLAYMFPRVIKHAIDNELISEKEIDLIKILDRRYLKKRTPDDDLIKMIKDFGEREGLRRYIEISDNNEVYGYDCE